MDDENVVLTKECSAIIERKLPAKLNDTCKFIILCTIRNLEVMNWLWGLGSSMNLMSFLMMKKLGFEEFKPTWFWWWIWCQFFVMSMLKIVCFLFLVVDTVCFIKNFSFVIPLYDNISLGMISIVITWITTNVFFFLRDGIRTQYFSLIHF